MGDLSQLFITRLEIDLLLPNNQQLRFLLCLCTVILAPLIVFIVVVRISRYNHSDHAASAHLDCLGLRVIYFLGTYFLSIL